MSTHLIAFQQSVDQAALARINLVTDQILTQFDGTRFLIPAEYNHIHWAYAGGISLTRAQIHSPSIDSRRMLVEVQPRKRGTDETPTRTALELWMPRRPISLEINETVEFQTAEDGAGATQQTGLIALGRNPLTPMPEGEILYFRATGTTTLTARTWTTVPMTQDQSLPPGTYALVAFYPFSTGIVAARAAFQGGGYRPGVLGIPGAEAGAGGDYAPAEYAQMMWYLMGTFTHLTFPQFEFFSISADTAETIDYAVIRTGPGPGQGGA